MTALLDGLRCEYTAVEVGVDIDVDLFLATFPANYLPTADIDGQIFCGYQAIADRICLIKDGPC